MKPCIFAVVVGLLASVAVADTLWPWARVELEGSVLESEDISGAAVLHGGEFLVIGSDETNFVQVLQRKSENRYAVCRSIPLIDEDDEIDIEGLAADGDIVYVIGSHSRRRKKVGPDEKTQKQNLGRLEDNKREPSREHLFRFKLNNNGELASSIESVSLNDTIDDDDELETFRNIPSKENGVDIEGLAIDGNKLRVGFRGPVFREGYTPVLRVAFDDPDDAKKVFVGLHGRGIRGMTAVAGGFLLIGGPVGDVDVSYELYFWDGEEGVPGSDKPGVGPLASLGTIPLPDPVAKAESVVLMKESGTTYDVLILFDGIENGAATRFRIPKP